MDKMDSGSLADVLPFAIIVRQSFKAYLTLYKRELTVLYRGSYAPINVNVGGVKGGGGEAGHRVGI